MTVTNLEHLSRQKEHLQQQLGKVAHLRAVSKLAEYDVAFDRLVDEITALDERISAETTKEQEMKTLALDLWPHVSHLVMRVIQQELRPGGLLDK